MSQKQFENMGHHLRMVCSDRLLQFDFCCPTVTDLKSNLCLHAMGRCLLYEEFSCNNARGSTNPLQVGPLPLRLTLHWATATGCRSKFMINNCMQVTVEKKQWSESSQATLGLKGAFFQPSTSPSIKHYKGVQIATKAPHSTISNPKLSQWMCTV